MLTSLYSVQSLGDIRTLAAACRLADDVMNIYEGKCFRLTCGYSALEVLACIEFCKDQKRSSRWPAEIRQVLQFALNMYRKAKSIELSRGKVASLGLAHIENVNKRISSP